MKIDKKELSFLIGEGEGYNVEFKQAFSKNIAKDICAFANANGGRILVGVSDDGEIKGGKVTNSLKSGASWKELRKKSGIRAMNMVEFQKRISSSILKAPRGRSALKLKMSKDFTRQ